MFTVEEKLPEFWNLARSTAAGLRNNRFSDWDPLIEHIKPLLEPDFVESMDQLVPGWKRIATLHDGQTALHTLLVFAGCLNLPEYTLGEEQTCRELEWAAILHDFDKKYTRRDAAHPFRSAAVVAPIMPKLGFELLPGITQADLEAWSELVMAAQTPDDDRFLHDHTHLPEMVAGLHRCWGHDTSASRVLKGVMFHQSLPTVDDWPNPVLLSDEELAYTLSLADMQVLGPLMVADSDAWNLFGDVRTQYLFELRHNNAETRQRIEKANNPAKP